MEKLEKSKNSRVDYMDLYKGIGIMLMIFGHVSFWGKMDHFIHAFNMPMFFVASGFFYKKRTDAELTFGSFLKKKAKTMLIPYFAFGTINYLVFILLNGFEVKPIFHLIWVNNHDLAIAGALWFITALLIAESIYFLLDRYCFFALKTTAIISLALLGALAKLLFPIILPWSMSAAFVGVLFYYVGVWVRKYSEKIFLLKWYWIAILSMIEVVFIFVNGELNMRNEEYAIIPLSLLNATVFSVILLYFCKKCNDKWGKKLPNKLLGSVGENSIVYLCLNQLVIMLVFMALEPIGFHRYICKVICYAISSVVLYLLAEIVTRTKLVVLIGR
ncbi:Fucose 4-O-acetylase [Butyrivibrio sp. INlla14]|nr:Fucose 4-O-acetylase [Butyrivibrio sp. INlla14]